MQLIVICTSLRTVHIWTNGYESKALTQYNRAIGETIYFVRRIEP